MKKKIFIASAIVIGLLIFFAGLQNRTVHLPFSDEEVSYSDMWEKKQYSKIIEYGNTVLEKNPMDRNTLIFTGYAYFYQGISILDMDERNSCMEKAVVLLRQALLTDGKENADVMYVLGKAYYHMGFYYCDLAIKYLDGALKKGCDSKDIYEYLGLAYSKLDMSDHAVENFEKSMDINPSDVLILTLAQEYIKAGNMDKAGYYLDKTGTDNGVLREKSLLLQGQRYIGLKEFDKALESLSKVLELNPGSADAYYYIGEVYEAKGEMQKAKTQWRKAYNLNPDHYKSKLKLFK
ncbi:MAG: tetratricopeptide repeat protein [Spirochaetia bacterium]|nr:tetratricopeptide repeat protein [Bacteroidales bacterium]MBQ7746821.1 tetratricopeptide repeat protein [Spirochaetia bacterium]